MNIEITVEERDELVGLLVKELGDTRVEFPAYEQPGMAQGPSRRGRLA